MRVIVQDGSSEVFSYDTDKASECLCPGRNETRAVAAALEEAREFLVPGLGRTLPPKREQDQDSGTGHDEQ